MKEFKFLNDPQSYNPGGAFVAHLSEIHSKKELFRQLSIVLQLPNYFGFNWDALLDCLRDFHWIEQQRVVLVHDNFPELNQQELKIYLQVLVEAIKDWKEGDNHFFEVVFSEQVEHFVQQQDL